MEHLFALFASTVMKMNEKQLELIAVLQEMISGTLDTYAEDPTHAPAAWLLENWWNTLEAIKHA
jgi:hypothetical protein